jgi:hypothetical protein
VCNAVQRFSENGAPIDRERLTRKKADHVLSGSASNGFDSGASPNLRVVGSIPTRLTTVDKRLS